MSSDPTKTGVKYIGNDTPFVDTHYGSGLKFMPDQTRLVEPELAAKLTRHAEFVDDDTFDYVTATTNLTGGSKLSAGATRLRGHDAVPNVLFFGDSIPGRGYLPRIFSMMGTSDYPFGGSAFSIIGVSWECGAGSGTLTFDKTAKTLKWSPAVGGGYGPVVDVSRAGVYDIPGNAAGQSVRVVCRPRRYSAATEGDFTVTVTANTELDVQSGRNFPMWARALHGNQFNAYILSNGGSILSDIAEATWQIPVLAETLGISAFDAIVFVGGTNNLPLDSSLAAMKTDHLAVLAELKKYAPIIHDFTIFPRSAAMTAARRQIRHAFNHWKLTAINQSGVVTLNADPYLVNPASATGDPVASLFDDGLHPAGPAAKIIGKIAGQSIMQGRVSRVGYESSSLADTYDATNNPQGNAIAAYSGFTGAGGTVGAGTTGPVPDGWYGYRSSGTGVSAVITTDARPDGLPGNALKIVITGATDAGVYTLQLVSGVAVAVGNSWVGKQKVYIEAATNLEAVECFLNPGQAGGSKVAKRGGGGLAGYAVPLVGETLTIDTPVLPITTGMTAVNLALAFSVPATGSATVWVMPGEPTLRRA